MPSVFRVTRDAQHVWDWVKAADTWADTQPMMITKEQARAAAAQLANHPGRVASTHCAPVSAEVLSMAIAAARNAPAADPRRVEGARNYLASDARDSRDVAAMMIQRIVCDALR